MTKKVSVTGQSQLSCDIVDFLLFWCYGVIKIIPYLLGGTAGFQEIIAHALGCGPTYTDDCSHLELGLLSFILPGIQGFGQ